MTPIADMVRMMLERDVPRDVIVTAIETAERNVTSHARHVSSRNSESKGAIRARRYRENKKAVTSRDAEKPPSLTKNTIKKVRGKKPSVTLRDDFQPNMKSASSAGLSQAEAEREFLKFKNHAAQNDRTSANWQASWSNWCIKAAEFMGRAPPPDPVRAVEISGYYAAFGSEQLEAWDRTKPGGYPRDKAGGWRFPTEWPPGTGGFRKQEDAA